MTKSRSERDFVIFTSCTYKPNSVRALAKAEAQYSHLSSLIDHSMGQAALPTPVLGLTACSIPKTEVGHGLAFR